MVYVQQVKEEKLRNKEEYRNKKSKSRYKSSQQKGYSSDNNFIIKRYMHHHLLVHLRREIKVIIMVEIHRTLRLHQNSPKVVWHKEVVGLLRMVGVAETISVSVVMATRVFSYAVKRVTT